MAEEKKSSGDGSVTFLNRGKRHYDLGNDAAGKPRRVAPGSTVLCSAEDAKRLSIYRDLVDISKLPGQVDARKLKAENEKLADENTRLKAQLLALPKEVEAEKPAPKEKKNKEKEAVAAQ